MAIDTATLTSEMYCPSCRALRTVPPPGEGYWAYCPYCGAILIDPASRRRYAGFWRRFGGWIVDATLVIALVAGLIAALYRAGLMPSDDETAVYTAVALYHAVSLLYYVPFIAAGMTPGKALAGVMVVDARGGRPGIKKSVFRHVVAQFSNAMLRLGYFWMIEDDDKQTGHDGVAGTYVVKR